MDNVMLSRRSFLKKSSLLSGGLIIGVPIAGCSARADIPGQQKHLSPNAFLQITDEGEVMLLLPEAEMGQGAIMGLATLVAEELNMDPQKITVSHAPPHPEFIREEGQLQVTGGSATIRTRYEALRIAAAQAKAVLLEAAAQQLKEDSKSLRLEQGLVINDAGNGIPIKEFVTKAKLITPPEKPILKPENEFQWIGQESTYRPDTVAKVTGTAEFGIDVTIPGLKKAALFRCPVIGGTVKGFSSPQISELDGVISIVEIFNGVAVVAETYWQAKNALEKVEVEWHLPERSTLSDPDIHRSFEAGLQQDDAEEAFKQGAGEDKLAEANETLEAVYEAPYLAHATMEPMNCTVHISQGQCHVWAPTQGPDMTLEMAEKYSGIHRDNIQVHNTFLGGGFGRRANQDYVAETTSIAKATGLPIQLVWSREDDMQNDFYRPAAMVAFNIGVDQSGNIETWKVRRVGPNVMPYIVEENIGAIVPQFLPQSWVDWMGKKSFGIFDGWTVDPASVEGLYEDYDAPNKLVEHVTVDPGLRCGFWRSVGHSFSGFFTESLMDELAHKVAVDPLEYRLRHAESNPRLKGVLELAAKKANWGSSSNGRFQGIASVTSFHSYVAEIAEVSIENGQLNIHKVTCAVDCGRVINPDVVRAQMMSGIIFGITAALYGKINIVDGAVQQSNFHDYPILRMNETPEIEVHIIESSAAPSGVGEPGLPPIAGAIGNAIFAATGKRLRKLPLQLS